MSLSFLETPLTPASLPQRGAIVRASLLVGLSVAALGCEAGAVDPASSDGELVILRADAAGLEGQFRATATTISFETAHGPSGEVSFRVLDPAGAVLAYQLSSAAPTAWTVGDEPGEVDREALALLPAVADALVGADLGAADLEADRDALIASLETTPVPAQENLPLASSGTIYFGVTGCYEYSRLGMWNNDSANHYASWTAYFTNGMTSSYGKAVAAHTGTGYSFYGSLSRVYASGAYISFWKDANFCM